MENEKVCPECENHCPVDQLRCSNGRRHFGIQREEKNISTLSADEALMQLLRKCGHYLHHNVGHGEKADTGALFGNLSEEEKKILVLLLQKGTQSWKI